MPAEAAGKVVVEPAALYAARTAPPAALSDCIPPPERSVSPRWDRGGEDMNNVIGGSAPAWLRIVAVLGLVWKLIRGL